MVEVSNTYKAALILTQIALGALDTLSLKTQNKQIIHEGGQQKYFVHSFVQTSLIFLGEIFALIIYFISKAANQDTHDELQKKAQEEGKQLNFSYWKLILPAFLEVACCNLKLFALNFIGVFFYEVTRSGAILFQYVLSYIILDIRPKKHQSVGCLLIFVGLSIIGFAPIVLDNNDEHSEVFLSPTLQVIGFFLMIGSIFVRSLQIIYEETVLHKYHINHALMVGIEGIFGFAISTIFIVVLSQISCPYGPKYCALDSDGRPFFQNFSTFFEAFTAYPIVTIAVIAHIIVNVFRNMNGIAIIHHLNSITRRLSAAVRVLIIWIVGVIVTITLGKTYHNYVWENLAAGPLLSSIVGLVWILTGSFIYTKVITFECLDRAPTKQEEKIALEIEEEEEDGHNHHENASDGHNKPLAL